MMIPVYRSAAKKALIEMDERRSKFFAICAPIETEQDAAALIQDAKHTWPDASHHVFAWLLGRDYQLQRYSDAGEPQGTAGLPVMRVLEKNNLIQTAIVVTRYFGGIQLGAGGLGRAYSNSASLALKASGLAAYRLCRQYKLVVEYAHLDALQRFLDQLDYQWNMASYGMDAELLVAVPEDEVKQLIQFCQDETAGAALYEPGKQVYVPLPLPDPPD